MVNFNYDASIPAAGNNPSEDQPDMQTNFQSIKDLIAIDHVTFEANNGGQHTSVSFNQDASYVPVPPVSPPELFTNTVNGQPQLFYYTGDANHSSSQYSNVASNGSTFLFGGVILKWGTETFTAGQPTRTVTFTTGFPNNALAAFISLNAANPVSSVGTTNIGTSNFLARRGINTTNEADFFWIAIGN